MPDNINRSDLVVDFKDIYGTTINDKVEIKIYNTQLQSLKDVYRVTFKGQPETLSQVPAFPTGHAQMIVTPTKYRFKQRFINVQSGETNKITEYFFVDPAKAKSSSDRLFGFGRQELWGKTLKDSYGFRNRQSRVEQT